MGRVFRPRGRSVLPVVLCLSWAGCSSRPAGLRGAGPTGVEAASLSEESPSAVPSIPFRDVGSLPAGTLLTVRLKNSINSDFLKNTSTFAALVDEPVVVEGETLVPRGASVAGRIEAARSSTMTHNRGYVRLTLDLVDIAGRDLPIRTASLFARGNPESTTANAPDIVSLEQGRRLTFRLTEPVYMASQSSTSRP
jgi:hypothetical protein